MLAAVAVGASAFAFVTVNQPPPVSGDYTPPSVAEMNAANTVTAEPAETVEPRWTLDDARATLDQDDATVLVLGDSTTWAWAQEWAQQLADERSVTFAPREPGSDPPTYLPEVTYSEAGSPLMIYSGGRGGTIAEDAVDHLDDLIVEEPDLVLLNFGHNYGESGEYAATQMTELFDAVITAAPDAVVVTVLQQPQSEDANREVREAIEGAALDHGVPTLDVAGAFLATDDVDALLEDDGVHPNDDGYRLWADVTIDALN